MEPHVHQEKTSFTNLGVIFFGISNLPNVRELVQIREFGLVGVSTPAVILQN
jgi:hypothetical protein